MANTSSDAVSRGGRTQRRGDRQRRLILNTVDELLRTTSIGDLSVSRIAAEAGITRPAFYFYFETKHAVLAAALDDVWSEFDAATADFESFTFKEPSRAFSDRMVTGIVDVWRRHAHLLNGCLQSRPQDPQLDALWRDFIGMLETKLLSFVVPWTEQNRIHPVGKDLQSTVRALLGMSVWTLVEVLDSPAPQEEAMLEAIRSIWYTSMWGSFAFEAGIG